MKVKVLTNIMNANDQLADKNRKLLDANKVLALNIMASPGAGKTSLIMGTIARLKDKFRLAVIEGDIASTIDADKISAKGIEVQHGGKRFKKPESGENRPSFYRKRGQLGLPGRFQIRRTQAGSRLQRA